MKENAHYARRIEALLKARLAEPQPLIQVVIGPRQVGKTTAIRRALGERGRYETADSPAPLRPEDIEAWWAQALEQDAPVLAIDEVQKISGWSEIVKRLWDRQVSPLRLVLSGSAALAIERDLRESLAGRYELIRAEHWSFQEAQAAFGLTMRDYVEYGCYPGSVRFLDDPNRWAAYIRDAIVEPVIGRDILQLHPVQNPALLRQLFGVAVGLPAQVVSLHKLQGHLQDAGAVATLQHYLNLLGHGFLVTALQKYSGAPLRAKRSPPKLVIHDNGLLRAFERPPTGTLDPEKFGRYFENAVAARFVEAGWDVFYWNDRNLEVDLIAKGPQGENFAVEVKSAEADGASFKGLRAFCKAHPTFDPCLVSFVGQEVAGVRSLDPVQILSLSRA